MENIRKIIEEIEANIEQLRDEIKLKSHLGKAEAKDVDSRVKTDTPAKKEKKSFWAKLKFW